MPSHARPLRLLLLSAYDAASHRRWHQTLKSMMPEQSWTVVSLPPRHFSWRLRGNALSYAFEQRETLERDYDLLICTSMVDLSTLRGFVPKLASLPTLLYFHENQFAYPSSDQQRNNAETQVVPLYAALCADAIVFNSHFNRNSFLAGAKALLARLPDHVPEGLMTRLERATVLPVPLASPSTTMAREPALPQERDPRLPLEILWNHRWEYDKGPRLLLAVAQEIVRTALPCRLHIAGQVFRQQPAEFAEIKALLSEHSHSIGVSPAVFGHIESVEDYARKMSACDVVLSTAIHDFQGLAIQEASLAGCSPLAPSDLAYPEYLPKENLYARGEDVYSTATEIVSVLREWQELKSRGFPLPKASLDSLLSENLVAAYRELLTQVAGI